MSGHTCGICGETMTAREWSDHIYSCPGGVVVFDEEDCWSGEPTPLRTREADRLYCALFPRYGPELPERIKRLREPDKKT